ncbi:MAG: NADPH-dependent oxidoreductase, partial [Novosphingobium sp.]
EKTPEKVTKTAKMVAGNAAHLAGLLQASPYPG